MKGRKRTGNPSFLPCGKWSAFILTRLATLSGVSKGCRNSAVMSVSDWPEIWAEALEVPDGPGSKSLSSSSSPRLGSERGKETRCSCQSEQQALPLPGSPAGSQHPGGPSKQQSAAGEEPGHSRALPSKHRVTLGKRPASVRALFSSSMKWE